MASLKKISVKGFRSIKDLDLELNSLNILIGANGAGKSNLISLFNLLNATLAGRLQEYTAKAGFAHSILHLGPKVTPRLDLALDLAGAGPTDRYELNLFYVPNDTLGILHEKLGAADGDQSHLDFMAVGRPESELEKRAEEGSASARVVRNLIADSRAYHFHDTSLTSPIRQTRSINDNRRLLPDGGNLAAMLYAYRQTSRPIYQRIVDTVKIIMPDFADFDLLPDRRSARDIALNYRKIGSDYLFEPHQISDGSLRAMAIITLLLQPEAELPRIIVLDEPELGLHPHALDIIAGLIRAASVKSQVIVATQSPTFLNSFEPNEIITVESRQGQSHFKRLNPADLSDWLQDYTIGDLWQRNVLGGGPVP